jgi:hypothetical protein
LRSNYKIAFDILENSTSKLIQVIKSIQRRLSGMAFTKFSDGVKKLQEVFRSLLRRTTTNTVWNIGYVLCFFLCSSIYSLATFHSRMRNFPNRSIIQFVKRRAGPQTKSIIVFTHSGTMVSCATEGYRVCGCFEKLNYKYDIFVYLIVNIHSIWSILKAIHLWSSIKTKFDCKSKASIHIKESRLSLGLLKQPIVLQISRTILGSFAVLSKNVERFRLWWILTILKRK